MNRDDLGTLSSEGSRRRMEGGTVCGVEDNLHPLESVLLAQRAHQVIDVGIDSLRGVADTSYLVANRAGPRLTHTLLNGVLKIVGKFHAPAGEELDAVIRHGVVRCREHHAQISAVLVDEVGRRGSRDHADAQHVNTGAG